MSGNQEPITNHQLPITVHFTWVNSYEYFEGLKTAIQDNLQNIKVVKEDYSQKRYLLKIEGYYQNFWWCPALALLILVSI